MGAQGISQNPIPSTSSSPPPHITLYQCFARIMKSYNKHYYNSHILSISLNKFVFLLKIPKTWMMESAAHQQTCFFFSLLSWVSFRTHSFVRYVIWHFMHRNVLYISFSYIVVIVMIVVVTISERDEEAGRHLQALYLFVWDWLERWNIIRIIFMHNIF